MAGLSIKIDLQTGPARALLLELRSRGENTTPAMKIIGEIARTSIVKNFESEGRPIPWTKSRRALKEGGRTLTKSTRLSKSIVPDPHRDYVDIGTNVTYARIHNQGGEIRHPARERVLHFAPKDGRRKNSPIQFARSRQAKFGMKVAGKAYTIKMPKREFMMLQPEDLTEIQAALLEYFTGKQ